MFVVGDSLQPWRWVRCVSQKRWYLATRPHDVTTQKTDTDIFTAVRTSDLSCSFKMPVFWVLAPCSLEEVHRRFRGACCFHRKDVDCMELHDAATLKTVIFILPWEPRISLCSFPSILVSLFQPRLISDCSRPLATNTWFFFPSPPLATQFVDRGLRVLWVVTSLIHLQGKKSYLVLPSLWPKSRQNHLNRLW
jgi:hypothetical protein